MISLLQDARRDHADDAQQLALPGLQPRRCLLQEIKQILFGQSEQGAAALPQPEAASPIATGSLRDSTSDSSESSISAPYL